MRNLSTVRLFKKTRRRRGSGDDTPDNLVLLCPNHHAIAHAIGRGGRDSSGGAKWYGKQTAPELVAELRRIDRPIQARGATEEEVAASVQHLMQQQWAIKADASNEVECA